MNGQIGVGFSPFDDEKKKQLGGGPDDIIPRAIQILSMRMPQFFGAGGMMPYELAQGLGGGVNPAALSPVAGVQMGQFGSGGAPMPGAMSQTPSGGQGFAPPPSITPKPSWDFSQPPSPGLPPPDAELGPRRRTPFIGSQRV